MEILRHAGHPCFVLGRGRDATGMVLDGDTDSDEVRQLVTETSCVLAPTRLVALVDRPPVDEPCRQSSAFTNVSVTQRSTTVGTLAASSSIMASSPPT